MKVKPKRSLWKWLFWGLLMINFVGIGTVIYQGTAPLTNVAETKAPKSSDASLELVLSRKQVNALSSNYLNQFLKDKKIKYQFIVGKKYASVIGVTKFMGVQVKFALNSVPEKTSQGNVLLHAKSLSVGQLKLPMSYIMGYIKKHYTLPDWVSLNQKKRTILLDLNKYSQNKAINYHVNEINMEQGEFRIGLTIPKQ